MTVLQERRRGPEAPFCGCISTLEEAAAYCAWALRDSEKLWPLWLKAALCLFAALTKGGVDMENVETLHQDSGGYMFHRRALIAAIALSAIIVAAPVYAQDKFIVVVSTTSTQDSGLYEYLLPIFKHNVGIAAPFVHVKSAEEKFLAEGGRRETLSCDVQRLCADRSKRGSCWHQGYEGCCQSL